MPKKSSRNSHEVHGQHQGSLDMLEKRTGFTIIDCIPRKRAGFVAEILAKYFSLFGFPTVLHTNSGEEFTAKEVLEKMKKMSPHLTTVTGRPRTPRDQGSVKRSNQVVKNMLYVHYAKSRASIFIERKL
jgi:hypothetical protein